MTAPTDSAAHAKELVADLRRLIEALDRRLPRLERLHEGEIIQEAADLRKRAEKLIRQLEGANGAPVGPATPR